MNNRKQIGIGVLLSYFSIALNLLAGLVYTPWIVRQIGQNQYGLYILASSLITLLMVDFGLSSAAARYVSNYHARQEEEKVNQFLGVIYKLYIVIDAVIFTALIIVFFSIEFIYANLTPEEIAQFKLVYCIAAAYSLINFPFVTLNGILTAYEKFIQLKLADVIYRLLLVSLTVFALLRGWGLYALVTVNAISGLLVLLYKFIVIKKTTPVEVDFHYSDKNLYKEIFGYSIWITIASLAQRLVFNTTPTILGMVADTAAIAIFGIVMTIEGYTYTIATAINGMFMPKISRIYAGNDKDVNLMPLMLQIGRFQFFLNGLIVAGFACVGRQFIQLWMGDAYIEAYWGILLVIIPGMYYNSLEIAHAAVLVRNMVKITAFVSLVVGLVNIVLAVGLSSYYGVIGACTAIFVSYMLRAILLNVIYHRALNLDMIAFAKTCYLKMTIPVLLSIGVGMSINELPLNGWLGLSIKGVALGVLYILLVLSIALSKNDRKKLLSFVSR